MENTQETYQYRNKEENKKQEPLYDDLLQQLIEEMPQYKNKTDFKKRIQEISKDTGFTSRLDRQFGSVHKKLTFLNGKTVDQMEKEINDNYMKEIIPWVNQNKPKTKKDIQQYIRSKEYNIKLADNFEKDTILKYFVLKEKQEKQEKKQNENHEAFLQNIPHYNSQQQDESLTAIMQQYENKISQKDHDIIDEIQEKIFTLLDEQKINEQFAEHVFISCKDKEQRKLQKISEIIEKYKDNINKMQLSLKSFL